MVRQVIKSDRLVEKKAEEEGQDKYLSRLLKLIPGETVALFLFLIGILKSSLSPDGRELQVWLWVIFGIMLVLNIFYLIKLETVTDPAQLGILTLAFAIWVYTIGGPFVYLSFYRPFIGSIILGLFTFCIPIFYKGKDVS